MPERRRKRNRQDLLARTLCRDRGGNRRSRIRRKRRWGAGSRSGSEGSVGSEGHPRRTSADPTSRASRLLIGTGRSGASDDSRQQGSAAWSGIFWPRICTRSVHRPDGAQTRTATRNPRTDLRSAHARTRAEGPPLPRTLRHAWAWIGSEHAHLSENASSALADGQRRGRRGVDGSGLQLSLQSLGTSQTHSWCGFTLSGLQLCRVAVAAREGSPRPGWLTPRHGRSDGGGRGATPVDVGREGRGPVCAHAQDFPRACVRRRSGSMIGQWQGERGGEGRRICAGKQKPLPPSRSRVRPSRSCSRSLAAGIIPSCRS
jgi:hypothetical protein